MSIDCKDKRFFLSGPMSGVPLNNVQNFARVHAELKTRGAGPIFDPAIMWVNETKSEESHEHWMRICLNMLITLDYDYVVMLVGWEDSDGAKLEHDVAKACGMNIIEEPELGL